MAETKWTPGPWEARGKPTAEVIAAIPQLREMAVHPHVVHRYLDAQGRHCTTYIAECASTTAPNEANAHLVAAAPLLYEALAQAYDVLGVGKTSPWAVKARAALAAARGET